MFIVTRQGVVLRLVRGPFFNVNGHMRSIANVNRGLFACNVIGRYGR